MIPPVLWPILVFALTVAGAQQPAARDTTARPDSGRGVIRRRVTAAATGQPLHRVRVTLNTQNPNPPSAVTDTRGLFEITGVPPGAYSLTAARAGYLPVQYGQRRPREPGRTIQVASGETIEGIDLAL